MSLFLLCDYYVLCVQQLCLFVYLFIQSFIQLIVLSFWSILDTVWRTQRWKRYYYLPCPYQDVCAQLLPNLELYFEMYVMLLVFFNWLFRCLKYSVIQSDDFMQEWTLESVLKIKWEGIWEMAFSVIFKYFLLDHNWVLELVYGQFLRS